MLLYDIKLIPKPILHNVVPFDQRPHLPHSLLKPKSIQLFLQFVHISSLHLQYP